MSPERVQLRRSKGWRKPEGAVVVTRSSRRWGNPYRVGDLRGGVPLDRVGAVRLFARSARFRYSARWMEMSSYPPPDEIRAELGGHDLACWCPIDQPCHADVLLGMANDLPAFDWLVTIGTKSAVVSAPTITAALLAHGGHTARLASPDEIAAWNEVRDLTAALNKARTVADRRSLLGLDDGPQPADYDVPLFGATP